MEKQFEHFIKMLDPDWHRQYIQNYRWQISPNDNGVMEMRYFVEYNQDRYVYADLRKPELMVGIEQIACLHPEIKVEVDDRSVVLVNPIQIGKDLNEELSEEQIQLLRQKKDKALRACCDAEDILVRAIETKSWYHLDALHRATGAVLQEDGGLVMPVRTSLGECRIHFVQNHPESLVMYWEYPIDSETYHALKSLEARYPQEMLCCFDYEDEAYYVLIEHWVQLDPMKDETDRISRAVAAFVERFRQIHREMAPVLFEEVNRPFPLGWEERLVQETNLYDWHFEIRDLDGYTTLVSVIPSGMVFPDDPDSNLFVRSVELYTEKDSISGQLYDGFEMRILCPVVWKFHANHRAEILDQVNALNRSTRWFRLKVYDETDGANPGELEMTLSGWFHLMGSEQICFRTVHTALAQLCAEVCLLNKDMIFLRDRYGIPENDAEV